MATHKISAKTIDLKVLGKVLEGKLRIELSEEAAQKIDFCRTYLDEKIKASKDPIYGINTGFGSLYNKSINNEDLELLQNNLVRSHACGTGDEVPAEIIRLMLFLKVQGLSYGHSGVQKATVERLIELYNRDILPVVFQQGSLGASGDLAPLAHLSLPLIGEGNVYYKGTLKAMSEVNERQAWQPIHLKSKEGLALLNGTQFMSAYGSWCIMHAVQLLDWANLIAAMSLEAFDGRIEPFHELIQVVRPHKGQKSVAAEIRNILDGSAIINHPKKHVQDPYSFRCIPQVHGASCDAIDYATRIILEEVNSVTDNPTIFADEDLILSAGNFHGQPLALALDFLAIALSELGSISERRTYLLISGQRDLPHFLVNDAGLNSGFMIPQYTAASLVSQNKQLCTPASVDSIMSSNGQEDHVSMGANAATKAYRVVKNLEQILAIELFTAAQALEFRRPLQSSPAIEKLFTEYRKTVTFVGQDRILSEDMHATAAFIHSHSTQEFILGR